jgi:hypothetical protein
MNEITIERPRTIMGKQRGRPKKSLRDDMAAKLERRLVTMAKSIADYRGVPTAEVLSDAAREQLLRMYNQMLKELDAKGPGR